MQERPPRCLEGRPGLLLVLSPMLGKHRGFPQLAPGSRDVETVPRPSPSPRLPRSRWRTSLSRRSAHRLRPGARSWEFEPNTRSARVAVHFTSPDFRSRALEHVLVLGDGLPLRTHVEHVHEEVVGQGLRLRREDPMLGAAPRWRRERACRPEVPSSQARSA